MNKYVEIANSEEGDSITLDSLLERLTNAREIVGGDAFLVIDFDASHLRDRMCFAVPVDAATLTVPELVNRVARWRSGDEAFDEIMRRASRTLIAQED